MSGDLATPGADALGAGTAMPTTLYVQFHTGDPGTNGTANVASASTRKSFTVSATTNPTGYRRFTNAAKIEYLNAPANETITHISIWSASSGGTCWFLDDVADTAVTIGQTITIEAGALLIDLPVWQ